MKLPFLFSILSVFIFTTVITAQPFDFSKPIPLDTSIIKGKLPNGITYYIKKNSKPENRMELRLAVNAGSILEDENEQGLAHFLEHMAFNGTKNFEKNDLVSYLQTMGIRFGADLNAYTSFDETVYMLFLPTDNSELLNKGFLVLQDWAAEITFDSLEIEKERGVVIEEWRLGRGAEQRMMDKYLPVIFHNSKYAQRLPIGKKEILDTFSRHEVVKFYKDWYRPDLMAIVAVGDFDKKEIESKIIEYFSKIPEKGNARERKNFEVPNHSETLYSITSDKEANMTTVGVFYKVDPKPENTQGDYRESVKRLLYFTMLNQRIDEITRNPEPPFINAYASFGNIGARSKYAYTFVAFVSDNGIENGLQALLVENERIKKFGFTPGEIERAKKQVVSFYEQAYNERDKSESSNYAAEFIRNFLTNEPILGITFEYNFVKSCIPGITTDEINLMAHKWITDSNRVVIVTAPEKEGLQLPDEAKLKKVVAAVENIQVLPYADIQLAENLIEDVPVPGKIIEKKSISELDVYELILSNGVKVLLKPSDFKNDEVLLSAISMGGQSLYPDNDHFSAMFSANIIRESGAGNYSATDLQKVLAGKTVNVSPYISTYTEGIKASCTPRDIETMFQLVHLYFAYPRFDEQAIQSWAGRIKSYLENIAADPQVYYSDQFSRTMSQNHPRGQAVPKPADIEKVNFENAYNIYKERFSNAGDFVFTIAGNINIDSIASYLELYIASLPSKNIAETWKDLGIRPPAGDIKKFVRKGADLKSMVSIVFTDTLTYSYDEAFYIKSLSELLNIRLIEVLREDLSGVYGVGASATLNRMPYQHYNITVRFPCSADNVDSLINETMKIFNDICQSGVSEKNITKIKETFTRQLEVNQKTNDYWLSNIENAFLYKTNVLNILKEKEAIETLKTENIQNAACKYYSPQNIKVILIPE